MTNDCVTLWIGDSLGPVERACLRSVLRQGHGLALYCYRKPEGTPDGVEIRDAAEVLSEDRIIIDRQRGSVAPFSDWFRYQLQRLELGTWVDADMYLLSPLDQDLPYLFGTELPGVVNNAVLRLPSNSPMLTALLEPFEQKRTPRWLRWRPYLRSRVLELVGGRADLSRLPWGSTGPSALTAVARQFGLISKAVPQDVFYPVPWQAADWIVNPSVSLNDMVTERTVGVHLWNECIKQFKNEPAPKGSFLNRLHQEGEI